MSVPDPPVSFSSSSVYIQCLDATGAGWERPCILSPPTWPFRGSIHLLRAGDVAMECFRCCGHISWNLCLEQFSTKIASFFFPRMWLWSRSLDRLWTQVGDYADTKTGHEKLLTRRQTEAEGTACPQHHMWSVCAFFRKGQAMTTLKLPKSSVYDCAPAIHWDQFALLPPSCLNFTYQTLLVRAILWSWLRFTYKM